MSNKMIFNVICGSSVAIAATIIGGIYFRKTRTIVKAKKSPMYKCFFFNEKGIRSSENNLEVSFNMLSPVIEFINSAETTLDLCFYMITDRTIIDAIIKAKKRNIKIRLITDYHSGIINNRFVRHLFKEGVPIYAKNVDIGVTIMHNKFAIKDSKELLQASLNLTTNSKAGYDNIMITDDPHLVIPFKEHFEEIVNLFDDDNKS